MIVATRQPRKFAPGEKISEDDFLMMSIGQLWFSWRPDSPRLWEDHEARREACDAPICWDMTRERIYEEMDRSALENRPAHWLWFAEALRDRMTRGEMERENRAHAHAGEILRARGECTFEEACDVFVTSFNFTTLVEGEPRHADDRSGLE